MPQTVRAPYLRDGDRTPVPSVASARWVKSQIRMGDNPDAVYGVSYCCNNFPSAAIDVCTRHHLQHSVQQVFHPAMEQTDFLRVVCALPQY